ncbi:MerR family transcriptional regulator [Phytoactinopolyspora halotolerans]|uniref:MerR family transcriptional regulator n=1 Tax=Phytoactinopolyspora halotolerans TaxID=1981512 RepID=A0A6L9S4T1_9ACTN|nr:MerR family transcriptional regulator [Phytoactinopolyspora halotolerans]NED99992.1 MerR family transcriptional regulator [Phytoactinopolyspora halotolerans]
MATYTPSQVAAKTGFSLDTLRYYERIGLLGDIARTSGGRRTYDDDDLGWLGMVQCLRDTGMPIADMLRFAELCRNGDDTIPERIALLEQHDATVQEKIAHLNTQQQRISNKIQWYRDVTRADDVPSKVADSAPV